MKNYLLLYSTIVVTNYLRERANMKKVSKTTWITIGVVSVSISALIAGIVLLAIKSSKKKKASSSSIKTSNSTAISTVISSSEETPFDEGTQVQTTDMPAGTTYSIQDHTGKYLQSGCATCYACDTNYIVKSTTNRNLSRFKVDGVAQNGRQIAFVSVETGKGHSSVDCTTCPTNALGKKAFAMGGPGAGSNITGVVFVFQYTSGLCTILLNGVGCLVPNGDYYCFINQETHLDPRFFYKFEAHTS